MNGVSIEINECANITIDDNTIREGGITVSYSTNITIINNNIKGRMFVIQSSGIIIHNNEQTHSDNGYASTLVLRNSHNNIISNNNLVQNDIVVTKSSKNNIFYGNTINGHFTLREVDSNIIRNNLVDNKLPYTIKV